MNGSVKQSSCFERQLQTSFPQGSQLLPNNFSNQELSEHLIVNNVPKGVKHLFKNIGSSVINLVHSMICWIA